MRWEAVILHRLHSRLLEVGLPLKQVAPLPVLTGAVATSKAEQALAESWQQLILLRLKSQKLQLQQQVQPMPKDAMKRTEAQLMQETTRIANNLQEQLANLTQHHGSSSSGDLVPAGASTVRVLPRRRTEPQRLGGSKAGVLGRAGPSQGTRDAAGGRLSMLSGCRGSGGGAVVSAKSRPNSAPRFRRGAATARHSETPQPLEKRIALAVVRAGLANPSKAVAAETPQKQSAETSVDWNGELTPWGDESEAPHSESRPAEPQRTGPRRRPGKIAGGRARATDGRKLPAGAKSSSNVSSSSMVHSASTLPCGGSSKSGFLVSERSHRRAAASMSSTRPGAPTTRRPQTSKAVASAVGRPASASPSMRRPPAGNTPQVEALHASMMQRTLARMERELRREDQQLRKLQPKLRQLCANGSRASEQERLQLNGCVLPPLPSCARPPELALKLRPAAVPCQCLVTVVVPCCRALPPPLCPDTASAAPPCCDALLSGAALGRRCLGALPYLP